MRSTHLTFSRGPRRTSSCGGDDIGADFVLHPRLDDDLFELLRGIKQPGAIPIVLRVGGIGMEELLVSAKSEDNRALRPAGRKPLGKTNSRTKRKRRGRVQQAELDFRSWGGARKGAGRKPKGERGGMAHISRPAHKARFPLLITSRLRPGLRSLRHEREAECIRRALVGANCAATAAADHAAGCTGRAAPFQVVHHSIQSNHLHLIVEADDRASLTAGMRGLLVRIARALNRQWKRRGPVFADRFHERELRKPLEVRNALVYVLQNLRKHGIALAGPDPLSSGPEFGGWSAGGGSRFGGDAQRSKSEAQGVSRAHGSSAFRGGSSSGSLGLVRAARAEVPEPKTWLLGVGWRTHGLIDPRESPRRS